MKLLSFLLRLLAIFCSSVSPGFCSNKKEPQIKLGIDVLRDQHYTLLKGKRVGLLTQPAGVDRFGTPTVQILFEEPSVQLMALYGPEHGIYGKEKADQVVYSSTDPKTKLPVHSLYGKSRRPSKEMLKDIDVLVVDLQDIGVRSYTYVSCMRYVMEECFKNGITVVVLDRPNPLGGLKVDGPPMDPSLKSYVGAYHAPYVHGLTIGELALLFKGEKGYLEISDNIRQKGKLIIVPMQGWKREMLWPDTGLAWVPTSPNIPTVSAVFGYPMTGLAGTGGCSHGVGTQHPFRSLYFKSRDSKEVLIALQKRNIPGLKFKLVDHVDAKGNHSERVYVVIDNWKEWNPAELNFHLMVIACEFNHPHNPYKLLSQNDALLFNKHTGSQIWWNEIYTRGSNARLAPYLHQWKKEAIVFQESSKKYWLYK
jgi:uncharacterized protein YbbC (DUF1343 family)